MAAVLLAVVAGCASKGAREKGADSAEMIAAEPMMAQMAAAGSDTSSGATWAMSAAHAADIQRQIIYTAEMTTEVSDVAASVTQVEQTIEDVGGWLESKDGRNDQNDVATCTIRARVPASKFDEAMDTFRAMGDVRSERIDAQDVTDQLVDLEARLKVLRQEEATVAELFTRQGKIADVLEVERELSRIRGEIERSEATLRSLGERVAYSSISVTLQPLPSPLVRKVRKWDMGPHLLNAWRTLTETVRVLVIALIYIVICGGPFIVLIWIVARRARRRKPTPPEDVELPPVDPGAAAGIEGPEEG